VNVAIFEDSRVNQLYPIPVARPAFAISCGGYRLADLLPRLDRPLFQYVRPHLQDIVAEDEKIPTVPRMLEGLWAFVNARLVPHVRIVDQIRGLLQKGSECALWHNNAVAAAILNFSERVGGPSSR